MTNAKFSKCRASLNGVAKLAADPNKAYYVSGFLLIGGCEATDCISDGNVYGFRSDGGAAKTGATFRRCVSRNNLHYNYIAAKGQSGFTLDKCSGIIDGVTPLANIMAQQNTGYLITAFRRFPAGVGTTNFSGSTGTITYADT